MTKYDAQYKKNMEFLAREVPVLHKLIEEHAPASELLIDEDKLNIRTATGEMLYRGDGIAEIDNQVQKYIKTPSRIVIGSPAWIEKDFEEPTPKFGGEWLTSKYDDEPQDFHYGRYLSSITKTLSEAGIPKVGAEFKGQPYYLFLYGVGLGTQIFPLLRHYRPKVLLLIDENKDCFKHSASVIDWEEIWTLAKEIGTSIKLTVEPTTHRMVEGVRSIIMTNSLCGLDGLHTFIHGKSMVVRGAYQALMDPKSANMASFIGFTTDEYNMMKNSFRNLRQGTKRILTSAQKKLRYPVLIVGSGPSLEANIDHLKRIRNRFILVSSGSSLKILLKNGITPDFHANLERAKSILERHIELEADGYADEMKKIYAVMTTTIWPGIDKYFKDTVYFIRPALSPLGVFAENYDQVLFNEGPQVTNTAVSFMRRLAVKEIYLLGVDLGTTNPELPRSESAWQAQRPRKLNIPIRGNKNKTVFSDMALIQQKDTLESGIRKLNEVGGKCYNYGDGAKIAGAEAVDIEKFYPAQEITEKDSILRECVEQFPVYDRLKFQTMWTNEVVRESVARFAQEIRVKLSMSGWKNEMITDIEAICSYNNKPLRQQYAPRLFRGSFLRIFLHAHCLVQRYADREDIDDIISKIKEEIKRQINLFEQEGYALADELESEDDHFRN